MTLRIGKTAACLLTVVTASYGFGQTTETAAPPAAAAKAGVKAVSLADSVVIGASVSAGAEVSLPGFPPTLIEGHANLADVLGAMLAEPAAGAGPRINAVAPRNLASWHFFENPEGEADSQLKSAKAANPPPPVVVAIDYLFWHAYGYGLSDAERRAAFDRGLERLASLPEKSTIVIADLPDMTHAVGVLLSREMVPPVALQEELNTKLAAWAAKKEHANVVMLPLRKMVSDAWASRPVTLGGRVYNGDAARGLLTNSGLHATAEGLIALAGEVLDRLKARGAIEKDATWEHDPKVIMQRLVDGKKARDEAKAAARKAREAERAQPK